MRQINHSCQSAYEMCSFCLSASNRWSVAWSQFFLLANCYLIAKSWLERRRRFWHATHDCVAPYVDIILHRGRFWAKSKVVLFHILLDDRTIDINSLVFTLILSCLSSVGLSVLLAVDVATHLVCCCVWQSSRSKQQTMFVPAKLTVVGVFSQLRDIASMSGNAVSLVCSILSLLFM